MKSIGKPIVFQLSLFLLGLVAMSVQVTTIRQALSILDSNELVIGLCMGAWMILTATGAFIGSRLKYKSPRNVVTTGKRLKILALFLSGFVLVSAFFMTLFMVYLKDWLLPPGAIAGLNHILFILFTTLTPFCLASGMLFPILADALSRSKSRSGIHTAYALDSAGSIIGGLLLGLLVFLWPQTVTEKPFLTLPDRTLYRGQEILESIGTPYGKLTLTRLADQYSLYVNGDPVLLSGDAIQREEPVHYAMLLHPRPEAVLMIGGGIGGTIDEALKYPGTRVDYLETNPWLIRLVDRYIPFPSGERIRIISDDARVFLARNETKYDIILLNTANPNSAEINRFYTREFFRLAKDRMQPGGVLSLSIPAAGNYMSEASRMLHSVIYKTLSKEFTNIRIIPGHRDYFIASDRDLNHSLWEKLNEESISNSYINPQYIHEPLMESRGRMIMDELSEDARTNTDLLPYVYLQSSRQWLNQFRIDFRLIPAILAALALLGFIFLGPLNLGLFVGGFTVSSLEFILILWFQVLFGNAYQMTAVIFAIFMAGMVTGSVYQDRIIRRINSGSFLVVQGLMACLAIIQMAIMLIVPTGTAHWTLFPLIMALVLASGMLMGMQFSLSGRLRDTGILRSAGESFSADLLGSAVGIILVSVYLVPQLGLPLTALVLAGMNLAAVWLMKRRRI